MIPRKMKNHLGENEVRRIEVLLMPDISTPSWKHKEAAGSWDESGSRQPPMYSVSYFAS